MSQFSKAMKNKDGKTFIKYKDKLECLSNGDITDFLADACVNRFNENKREFKKFRRVLRFKKFLKYDVPLFAMLVGSGFVIQTPRDTEVVPYYNLEQTMLSDNKLVKEVDTNNYIVLPSGYEVDGDYLEVDNVNKIIQYQVKSGTRSAIVTVGLDDEGTMEVVDSLVGNFFDRNSDVFEDIEEMTLDEKYQELIDDIDDFIIESQSLNSNTKKEIKKLLESEKVNIITTVAEYVQVGELNLEETDFGWYGDMIMGEFVVLLVTVMIGFMCRYLMGANEIRSIYVDGDKFIYGETNDRISVSLKSSLDYAKAMFVKADDARRSEVRRLVRSNLAEESQAYFK